MVWWKGVCFSRCAKKCKHFILCTFYLKKSFFFSYACLEECNAAIHKKCIDKIIGRCTGTAANSRDTMVRAGTVYLE